MWKGRLSKNLPRGFFCRDLARNAHIYLYIYLYAGLGMLVQLTTFGDVKLKDITSGGLWNKLHSNFKISDYFLNLKRRKCI